MVDRFASIRKVLPKSFLSICIFIISGCSPLFGPTPVPAGTICIPPPNSEANPYQHAVELAVTQTPVVNSSYLFSSLDPIGTRQRALAQLGRDTGHLSDQVDIATNDTNMVRIVATYLDPELIQYIILNHYLNNPELLIGQKDLNKFDEELTQTLENFGKRNEILFLITVTSPFYRAQAYNSNVLNIQMPITEMVLINGSSRRVKPTHADYILGANIDITHGPVSGIVGYPIAVIDQGQCVWIIDQWTNTFTLELSRVKLGETEFGSQVWSIPFRSLIMPDNNYPTPTFDPMMGTPVSKLDAPPTPYWIPNAQKDPTDYPLYWEEMGRYIWNYMIAESHR